MYFYTKITLKNDYLVQIIKIKIIWNLLVDEVIFGKYVCRFLKSFDESMRKKNI